MEAQVHRYRRLLKELYNNPMQIEWHAEAYHRGLKMEREASRTDDDPPPAAARLRLPMPAAPHDLPRQHAYNDVYHRSRAVSPQVSAAPHVQAHQRPYYPMEL